MPLDLLESAFVEGRYGKAAMVSSFGAESAVLLHLLSRINRAAPVIFIDTQMLFQETLDYQLLLAGEFGLRNVQIIRADEASVRREDAFGNLHVQAPQSCCALRKVTPLRQALRGYDAWVSGRKKYQSSSRAGLGAVEIVDGKTKLNPLADWSVGDVSAYFDTHDLPRHPLAAKGYSSIGCAACTTPVLAGEAPRAGRWRGLAQSECGIHFEGGKAVRPAA